MMTGIATTTELNDGAPANRFLTVKDVARIMRVSASTIWRYTNRGTLPQPIKVDGRTWWIEAEILAVIERKKAARQSLASADMPASVAKKRGRVRLELA